MLGVLVAGAWVASGWWVIGLTYHRPGSAGGSLGGSTHNVLYVYTLDGVVIFGTQSSSPNPSGFSITPRLEKAGWSLWHWSWGGGGGPGGGSPRSFDCTAPLWPVPVVLWGAGALLLRSGRLARRRALTGMCAACGYSLAGLAAGAPCPECGRGGGPGAVV